LIERLLQCSEPLIEWQAAVEDGVVEPDERARYTFGEIKQLP